MSPYLLILPVLTLALSQVSCVRTTTTPEEDLLIRAQEEIQNIP
ncbi:hypothetical protein [Roseibacillus persicicus]|uniref:Uncharacterized protein n=1 Tax=Roseibacillus persicicus TaxID=454148 RepID=A0A918TC18_9BACT|nr:hypothetical protein [Roseibacillus persicicus]MDQ8192393.1 hypothetical protein [Roseibacillus persicicus]GHC41398.1 hypothetical protein GCM10007100_02690 [Roseibacillus persicicus]